MSVSNTNESHGNILKSQKKLSNRVEDVGVTRVGNDITGCKPIELTSFMKSHVRTSSEFKRLILKSPQHMKLKDFCKLSDFNLLIRL